MALQVWMPFTDGTLKQQGLKNVSPTIGGTVNLTNAGKLGKCATIGTAAGGITLPASSMTSFTECSVAFWIKIISWNSSYATFFQAGLGSTPWNNYIFGILRNNANSNLCFTLTNSSGTSSSATYTTSNLNTGQWYHLAFTYKTGTICTYIDGELDKTYSTTYVPNFAGITHISIGRGTNNSGYQTNCNLNDFRIYDHCLSPMEVKELAKGLVLHYPLNHEGFGATNLIYNGFGELNNENWTSTNNIYTDVPSGQTDIKKSYRDNWTKEYIPIYRNHTYKFSAWVKAYSSSGTSYPSLQGYDVDKKAINNMNCPDGFNQSTMTTLTQQLSPGNTKIYVASLANWNANSGHYYNYAALFSYADSTGYIYPDGVYTQNTPAFGSGTNAKTNLDKTNNIITLNSAYTGPTLPVGTKVCASCAGSTYIYPFGGVANTSIVDWTFKEANISSEINRLKSARYVRVYAYSTCYEAGLTLTDLTVNGLNTEYDCSGFCNNGTLWAYDTAGVITYTNDTPKYQVSTYINSDNNTTNTASGTRYIYGNCELSAPQYLTVAFWCKPIGGYTYSTGQGQFSLTKNEIGASAGEDYSTCPMNHRDNCIDMCTSSGVHKTVSITFTTEEWHHYVIVYDGRYGRVYKDGVTTGQTLDMGSILPLKDMKGAVIGFSKAGGVWRSNKSYYSDFRIYATALSASDVKSLYQNCATIDADGTIHGKIR